MLFNSIEFAIFLPLSFVIYWYVANKNRSTQNIFLLGISYLFYGWWDYRFLFLILFSSFVDHFIGIHLSKTERQNKRKLLLTLSVIVNIGILGFFKYYNFFAESFADAFTILGAQIDPTRLNIILPVGISFYTFQTLSYTIDVYRRKLEPTKDIVAFFAFISFFPQLVAGPIERATNLLPQFFRKRIFHYERAVDGVRQILWGLFKKVVIADNCAAFANQIFDNHADYNGSTLLLGAVFFAFQIYGDFSGYSDIAIGTARLFGMELKQNFNFPYFARDMAEFWRKWHISLNTWFRDYLYIPLGGSRGGTAHKIRNIFIIFLVSGLWHGANWTFVVWGFLNACYFLPIMLSDRNRLNLDVVAKGKWWPTPKEIIQISFTFGLTAVAWVFFRAENINHALSYLNGMFTTSLFEVPMAWDHGTKQLMVGFLICLFIIVEWIGRENQYATEKIGLNWKPIYRYSMYYVLIAMILLVGGEQQQFIYFQF